MTEWEKLQNGLVYNDFDDDLFERRVAAKKLFRAYNKEDNVYINFGCVILDCAEVRIGANTLLGRNIGIYPVNHFIDAEERIQGGCCGKPIRIGRNVWLGGDVKILAGVTIGDNTVIGAGSIVTKDIPSDVVAVGNPCKVVRQITDKDKTDYNIENTARNAI